MQESSSSVEQHPGDAPSHEPADESLECSLSNPTLPNRKAVANIRKNGSGSSYTSLRHWASVSSFATSIHTSQSEEGEWICERCGYKNADSKNKNCALCGWDRTVNVFVGSNGRASPAVSLHSQDDSSTSTAAAGNLSVIHDLDIQEPAEEKVPEKKGKSGYFPPVSVREEKKYEGIEYILPISSGDEEDEEDDDIMLTEIDVPPQSATEENKMKKEGYVPPAKVTGTPKESKEGYVPPTKITEASKVSKEGYVPPTKISEPPKEAKEGYVPPRRISDGTQETNKQEFVPPLRMHDQENKDAYEPPSRVAAIVPLTVTAVDSNGQVEAANAIGEVPQQQQDIVHSPRSSQTDDITMLDEEFAYNLASVPDTLFPGDSTATSSDIPPVQPRHMPGEQDPSILGHDLEGGAIRSGLAAVALGGGSSMQVAGTAQRSVEGGDAIVTTSRGISSGNKGRCSRNRVVMALLLTVLVAVGVTLGVVLGTKNDSSSDGSTASSESGTGRGSTDSPTSGFGPTVAPTPPMIFPTDPPAEEFTPAPAPTIPQPTPSPTLDETIPVMTTPPVAFSVEPTPGFSESPTESPTPVPTTGGPTSIPTQPQTALPSSTPTPIPTDGFSPSEPQAFDLVNEQQLREDRNENYGNIIASSDDGRTWAIASNDGTRLVRVYSNNENGWQILYNKAGTTEEKFAHSIALSGDGNTLAIGSPGSRNNVIGKVHIINGLLTDPETQEIYDEQLELFGVSVSLSFNGNVLVVGGRTNVLVYRRNPDEYNPIGFEVPGEIGEHWNGWSSSLSNDGGTLAVGIPAMSGNDQASADVYRFDDGMQEWRSLNLGFTSAGKGAGKDGTKKLSSPLMSLSGNGNTVAVRSHKGSTMVFRFDEGSQSWSNGEAVDHGIQVRRGSVSLSKDADVIAVSGPDQPELFWYRDGGWVDLLEDEEELKGGDVITLSGNGRFVAVRHKEQDNGVVISLWELAGQEGPG